MIEVPAFPRRREMRELRGKVERTLKYITESLLPYPAVKSAFRMIMFVVKTGKGTYTNGYEIVIGYRDAIRNDVKRLAEIIIHEFLHIVLGHPLRMRKYTHPLIYNLASDIIVDSMASKYVFSYKVYHMKVLERVLKQMLVGRRMMDEYERVKELLDSVVEEPRNWSTERIYAILLKIFPDERIVEEILKMLARQIASWFSEKHDWDLDDYDKKQGYALLSNMVELKVLEAIIRGSSQLDWDQILRKLLVKGRKKGIITSWRRPSKRLIVHEKYYPRKVSSMINRLVIGVDVSGSIDNESYGEMAFHIASLVNSLGVNELYIIQFDAQIVHVEKLLMPGIWDIMRAMRIRHGFGGTSFVPIFDYVRRMIGDVDAIIILTDGEGEYPAYTPDYYTIWVLINAYEKPPFGEYVYV